MLEKNNSLLVVLYAIFKVYDLGYKSIRAQLFQNQFDRHDISLYLKLF